MNNVTISDLSEKSTLEDTDLFLVRDSNEADMKIKGKVFADKITDSLSGYTKDNDTLSTLNTASKKPVNSSAVNSALTNYGKINYYNGTQTKAKDCNSITDNVCLMSANYDEYANQHYPAKDYFVIFTNINGTDRIQRAVSFTNQKEYNRTCNSGTWSAWVESATVNQVNTTLAAQSVSNIFTIGENFNLSDIKIYANTTLLNIQRFIVTPKNAITSSTNYVVGTLSSYRPKQVLRFTAYVNHKGVEGYIETNGNVIVYLESGSSGNIIFDNIVYFY